MTPEATKTKLADQAVTNEATKATIVAEEKITGTTDTTTTSATHVTATDDDIDTEVPASSTAETAAVPFYESFANFFYLVIIFGILVGAFIWVGGLRYLGRFLPGGHARYSKVANDDLPK